MLDSWIPWKLGDEKRFEHAFRFASRLWGNAEHLRQQLIAAFPEVLAGFGIAELIVLQRLAKVALALGERVFLPVGFPNRTLIVAGGDRFTVWEARYEIVRRALGRARGN